MSIQFRTRNLVRLSVLSIMALPLFVRTAAAAFASVERELLEAGRTLGATARIANAHRAARAA